ncbi:acylneuraminate cytidylyltransferase family protein [Neolewinella antarctica]|uniref:N-acylneuraminate cytidylyltransferase n=1 Tax=Neolewinella antarctica TaxID=442734 RepID=A0ABX0XAL9_9BACT|nr:acylneuraminate cytidylyltransferase family protein [Neolewinella antarctica]NJC26105.1 N-acylneuraminate cytidylyltransferase [Neolewinella antarctica]
MSATKPEILAIVPARGGSKGLPGKNTMKLAGHPLIAYSIKAGLDAVNVTRVIVSTDSEEIAAVALEYGAEVPFLRPPELAGDRSLDIDFWQHALNWLAENEDYRPDYVVQLRPTSPIRHPNLIDVCIDRVISTKADSLRVVTPAPATPYKMWRVNDNATRMEPLLTLDNVEEPFNQLRQTLPVVYWQIGTLDVIRTSLITDRGVLSGDHIIPYIVEGDYAVDIDQQEDFEHAQLIIETTETIRFAETST